MPTPIPYLKAVNIVWETDGEDVDLPSEVTLPYGVDIESAAEYLSDEYGWLVKSLDVIGLKTSLSTPVPLIKLTTTFIHSKRCRKVQEDGSCCGGM